MHLHEARPTDDVPLLDQIGKRPMGVSGRGSIHVVNRVTAKTPSQDTVIYLHPPINGSQAQPKNIALDNHRSSDSGQHNMQSIVDSIYESGDERKIQAWERFVAQKEASEFASSQVSATTDSSLIDPKTVSSRIGNQLDVHGAARILDHTLADMSQVRISSTMPLNTPKDL